VIPNPPTLSRSDIAVVDGAWKALAEGPPPRDPQFAGFVVALGGMVLLTVVPALGNFVELGAGTAYGFLAMAVLLLLGGAGLAIGAGQIRARDARRELSRAAGLLRDPPTRESALREATVLLAGVDTRGGPAAVGNASVGRMARELGPGLETVRQVERHLVQSGRIDPVFTSAGGAPPAIT
jgi:hypothetical protein